MQDKFHFTSYWRYCFLHSGVMWDERCSANFILPEQLSPQTSVKSTERLSVRFLPRSTRLLLFQSTCWLNMRRSVSTAPLHSTSGSSRSVHPEQIPSTHILFNITGGQFLTEPVRVAQWLCSVPPKAALGTLRSAIGLSLSDVVASAERAAAAAAAPGVAGTSCEN